MAWEMSSGISRGEEYQSQKDGVLGSRDGGVREGGWDFMDFHLMSGMEVMPSTSEKVKIEDEDQENINIREGAGYGHKQKSADLDEAGEDNALGMNWRTNSDQHILSSSRNIGTNHVEKTDDIEPVEVRLLAALQREMGLSIGTTHSTQPVMNTHSAGDAFLPAVQKPGVLPNLLSNSSSSPLDNTLSLLEYRSKFPAEDVTDLREHHWEILRHVIPPRKLGLGNKDTVIPSTSDKPSSSVVDEMIEHLSGTTKLACLNFREAQKHIWRKRQRKSRAITRASQGTNVPGNIDLQLGYPPRRFSGIQDRQQYHRGHPQQNLYDNTVHQQNSRLLQRNPFLQRAGYQMGNMQGQSLHPSTRSRPHFPQRGIDEQRSGMACMPTANDSLGRRYSQSISGTHHAPSGISRQGLISRPTSGLPDPLLLPGIVLPLSEAEKAHIRLWLIKRY